MLLVVFCGAVVLHKALAHVKGNSCDLNGELVGKVPVNGQGIFLQLVESVFYHLCLILNSFHLFAHLFKKCLMALDVARHRLKHSVDPFTRELHLHESVVLIAKLVVCFGLHFLELG